MDDSIQPRKEGRIIDFPGGLYAVTHVHAGSEGQGIYEKWQELAAWVENSRYTPEFHSRQWLEESPNPFEGSPEGFDLELYSPVRE